jgi:4-hydroxybenzoate polyprenyltransferase/phosphoserine phosphatase
MSATTIAAVPPEAGSMSTGSSAKALPLCVDLDGTLVRTDMLEEGLLAALASLRFGGLVRALLTGRVALKRHVAGATDFDPASLPYNEDLLAWLREERAAGRRLVLATAADESVARRIADYLGLFEAVIASDGIRNLKGAAKGAALVEKFGVGGFVYAGDSWSDLAVWQVAGAAVLVNAPAKVAAQVKAERPVEFMFASRTSIVRAMLEAMRPHQWVKNLLVFIPIFTAHAIDNPASWAGGILAFVAFCTTASSIYIVNDLLDVQADRAHARKRLRPFARGALRLSQGGVLAAGLMLLGMTLAASGGIALVVGAYMLMSIAYSVHLKEQPLVDVFMLTLLYTIRIFGGGEATGHSLSLWLLGFSVFFFLSLAFIKRVEELLTLQAAGQRRAGRRGYTTEDITILQTFGVGAAFSSALTLALFVQAEAVARHYASPLLLWGIVPLLLFWQCRMWLSAARRYMLHDPIIYAASDWVSWVTGGTMVALLYAAKSMGPLF